MRSRTGSGSPRRVAAGWSKIPEYDDAKNEQAMLEHKIAQLEERLFECALYKKNATSSL